MTNYQKVQEAAAILNKQAYARQKTGKRFTPCAKADLMIHNQRANMPLVQNIQEALYEPCNCHNDLTFATLLDYCHSL